MTTTDQPVTEPLPGEREARDDVPRTVEAIDWNAWEATDVATLTFVRRKVVRLDGEDGDEVLLIHKKRGLGRGLYNAPGGRVEGDETILECAVRETREEVHVIPRDLEESGELRFQFADGHTLHVHVFVAQGHEGEPRETEEAIPEWTRVGEIPYDEMWEDDKHWIPHMLEGRRFDGRFVFDGDEMVDMELRVED